METLHNRNLFAYCDDNPLVRADQDGNAWMVAAASFVAGMGLSVGCQMIFEGKNLSEINWITAASAGLGTAMGFLGIGDFDKIFLYTGATSIAVKFHPKAIKPFGYFVSNPSNSQNEYTFPR